MLIYVYKDKILRQLEAATEEEYYLFYSLRNIFLHHLYVTSVMKWQVLRPSVN
jgi:hypothetical protein